MKTISYYPLECELKRQRMTKTQLQEETGLSSATIAKIKKDKDVSLKALRIIAEILDCDIDKLITFEEVYKKGSNKK